MKVRGRIGVMCSLALAGCATAPRLGTPPASPADAAPPGFSTRAIRSDPFDRNFLVEQAPRTADLVQSVKDGSIDILALSGGGAGGAFGAGILLGLTNANQRPEYEVVTGVSTGALIAPYAFLGSSWDGKLEEAYRGKATDKLMVSRGLGVLFSSSVFEGGPLRNLVNRFVTDELIDAVAQEAAKGRILLVATTNLDREETVVWNMGEIAQESGDRALELFRDVLVASASVPGVFPPVMIDVEKDGKRFQEMHIDGGASTPFFIAPDIAMILGYAPENLRGAHIYVVINGQAASAPRTTLNNAVDVASRSFTAVMNHMSRTALVQTEIFAKRSDMTFQFTMIPPDVAFPGPLAFDQASMQGTFDYGVRCASRGLTWINAEQALDQVDVANAAEQMILTPIDTATCPGVEKQE
jgi:predicted acylesterase/phospholipase RssA